MTNVKVFYNQTHVAEVEVKGHTGYAQEGRDIVCAAVSAITQSALLGLIEVSGVGVEHSSGEGYLHFKLSGFNEKSDAICATMVLGLKDLEQGYKRHIKLEEFNNVY